MSSVDVHVAHEAPPPSDDRKARARIRDAALHLFGERGFRAATVRDIAERAKVSPALVVHHFGSKQGLREAVEDHVLADIRAGKYAAFAGTMTPTAAEYDQLARDHLPGMAFLRRALSDDTEVGRRLYAHLHADAMGYLAAGVEAGVLVPSDDPQARAAILLNAGLAQLLLQPHMADLLGVEEPGLASRVAAPMLDLYTDGLFADDRFRAAWRSESTHVAGVADPDPPGPDGDASGATA